MMNLQIVLVICQFLYIYCVEEWNLPVFPAGHRIPLLKTNATQVKKIPKHLWISIGDPSDLEPYMSLITKNPGWEVHICSKETKDEFMNTVFAGTSYLWAYNLSCVESAKTNLWKYAVMWAFGGVYNGDKNDIGTPLDNVVEPEDTLIVAKEKNIFHSSRCYISPYKLSDSMAYRNETKRDLNIFHHRYLSTSVIFAAPRHRMIEKTMKNAVEIIRHEYHQESVISHLHVSPVWTSSTHTALLCCTGQGLFTASLREVILDSAANVTYRLVDNDFKAYGGRINSVSSGNVDRSPHRVCRSFLTNYLPEGPVSEDLLQSWQGYVIASQNSSDIFVVKNLNKRLIPDYDTFLAMNFTHAKVIRLTDAKMASIKTGSPISSLKSKHS